MRFFHTKKESPRSIDDILTPKESEKEALESEVAEECELTEEKNEIDLTYEPISALDCFGMKEDKTEKWLLKCVKVWYYVMSFVWFLFGVATFAPIMFVSNKINVIFKDKKRSLIVSIGIYACIVAIIIICLIVRNSNNGSPAPIS
jgi:hypothetical protein